MGARIQKTRIENFRFYTSARSSSHILMSSQSKEQTGQSTSNVATSIVLLAMRELVRTLADLSVVPIRAVPL